MKRPGQWLSTGVAVAMLLSAATLVAQNDNNNNNRPDGDRRERGRGGFGPEFQQRMMENLREHMKVKDDAEWKVLEGRVQAVMDARREIGFGGGNFGRLMRRPGESGNDDRGGGGGRGRGPEPTAEQAELDKAIDSNASKEDLKKAMAKLRDSKKEKEAKLDKAQEELKKILNAHQEAVALSAGLIK